MIKNLFQVQRVTAACFVFAVIFSVAYFISAIDEQVPVTDSNRKLESTVVKRGDLLILHNAYSREKRCDGVFSRRIYGQNGQLILSESEFRPAAPDDAIGDFLQATRAFKIPNDAPLGKAHYSALVLWTCNPVQRIWPKTQQLPELEFTIVDNKDNQ